MTDSDTRENPKLLNIIDVGICQKQGGLWATTILTVESLNV